jgi:hypothetical protein
MARAIRINIEGGWYHITNRGIERREIRESGSDLKIKECKASGFSPAMTFAAWRFPSIVDMGCYEYLPSGVMVTIPGLSP